ncbi:MAG: bacterioferritin-associated ferredoxin [Nitriliruptorales bacterium]
MYVCHCRVVTDREVREAIRCGARDVCAIAELCGAGSRCGGCLPALRNLLAEAGLPLDDVVSARTLRMRLLARQAGRCITVAEAAEAAIAH